MSHARELGFAIHELVQNNPEIERRLEKELDISSHELQKIYAGRLFLTGTDLQKIAGVCDTNLQALLAADRKVYDEKVVHYMTAFRNRENREKILDLIDAYIDVCEELEDL